MGLVDFGNIEESSSLGGVGIVGRVFEGLVGIIVFVFYGNVKDAAGWFLGVIDDVVESVDVDGGFEVVFFSIVDFDDASLGFAVIRVADVNAIFDSAVGVGVLTGDVVGFFGNEGDPRGGNFAKFDEVNGVF